MSVAYTAVLEVSEGSVLFLSRLLHAERVRRGTRKGARALGTYKQAVLVLRWFLDDTRMSALAGTTTLPCRPHTSIGTRASQCSPRGAVPARRVVGGENGGALACDPGRHADLHRPDLHPRPHIRGGLVVERQAPPPWREHPGRLRSGRVATVDLRGTARPRTRHQRCPRRSRPTGPDRRLDQRRRPRAGRSGLRRRTRNLHYPVQETQKRQLTVDEQAYNAIHGALRCSANAPTRYSRPPTKPSAATAAAPGASATSSPPHWCCSTTNTAAPHDQTEVDHTQRPRLRGMAH